MKEKKETTLEAANPYSNQKVLHRDKSRTSLEMDGTLNMIHSTFLRISNLRASDSLHISSETKNKVF